MLEINDALARCLTLTLTRRRERRSLRELEETLAGARALRLAAPLCATLPLPHWDLSAMDGYAVRADDVTPDQALRVIEVIPAGSWPTRTLRRGEASRIFTGAPLPDGADTVIIQENCDARSSTQSADSHRQHEHLETTRDSLIPEYNIVIPKNKPVLGAHIRRRGEELETGDLFGRSGQALTPGLLGLCAAQGLNEVEVWSPPRVALLETGSELVAPGEPLTGAQIYATHASTLAPMIARSGGVLARRARVVDDVDQVVALLRELARADIDCVITTGGVSVGDFDPLHEALARLDAERHFWKVRMKPGKPLSVASLRRLGNDALPIFGLPGNPVSCVVGYLLFVHPLLQRASGVPDDALGLRRLTCTLNAPLVKRHRRAELFRVCVTPDDSDPTLWGCRLTGGQSSGWISSVAIGDGLLWTPSEPIDWPCGHRVEVALFPWWEGRAATINFGGPPQL